MDTTKQTTPDTLQGHEPQLSEDVPPLEISEDRLVAAGVNKADTTGSTYDKLPPYMRYHVSREEFKQATGKE